MSHPSCTCCGGSLTATFFRDQFAGHSLARCERCGHLQASVMPDAEALAAYYQRRYSRERGQHLGSEYLAIMARRARAQCDFMERAGLVLHGLRVCDVGCGYGALLQELTRRGARAVGLDYDPACIRHCRELGLSVQQISDEDQALGPEGMDLVTMSHTLEHLRDVERYLLAQHRRGTRLFVEVPRYSIELPEQFRDQEGHLHFFAPGSLETLLARSGLRVLVVSACGPDLTFYWSDRLERFRRALRRLGGGDWFFNAYNVEHRAGMWIRAVAAPAN